MKVKNVLASACDGNIELIKAIIENSSQNEYVRVEALEALEIAGNNASDK